MKLSFGLSLALMCCGTVLAESAPRFIKELEPFWSSKTMIGESVLFLRDPNSQEVSATLLFTPRKVLSVKSSSGEVTYLKGKDYVLCPRSGKLVIPPGSIIPVKTEADVTRPAGTQMFRLTRRDGKGEILFGGLHEYHDMQVVVSYTHAKHEWKAPPARYASTELPRTLKALKARKPVSIALFGDSISTGCNASKWAQTAPFQPFYGELLVQKLESVYKTKVTLTNFSQGGMTSGWGSQNIAPVAAARPDLVILAWGMNDGCPADEFIANLQTQMTEVRKANPAAEFILVATMLPNEEWAAMDLNRQIGYRNAMSKITGPGIALADVTAVWEGLLKRKTQMDITGNGVNHPNDFGHRLYAQVLGALLIK